MQKVNNITYRGVEKLSSSITKLLKCTVKKNCNKHIEFQKKKIN